MDGWFIPSLEALKVKLNLSAGTSTPPSIAATPVPALPPPIAVNSYPSVPAPPSGQSATEALYTNGVHAYQGAKHNFLLVVKLLQSMLGKIKALMTLCSL